MRTRRQSPIIAVACCAAIAAALLALGAPGGQTQGEGYESDWHTVDGGGGQSEGANYSLTGSIGQPDAGELSGPDREIRGGFLGGAEDPAAVTAVGDWTGYE